MLSLFLLLVVLEGGRGLRVITRSMIRSPVNGGLPVEYQPVPLRVKEEDAEVTTTTTEETSTSEEATETTTQAVMARAVTKLYPVDGLWEDRQILEPDLWGILRTAYYCLFTGLDCFSARVFPMVKSFVGYQNFVPFPRASQRGQESQPVLGEEERQRLSRMMKELTLGLLLVGLPWLGGAGMASGRAILNSLVSAARPSYYM